MELVEDKQVAAIQAIVAALGTIEATVRGLSREERAEVLPMVRKRSARTLKALAATNGGRTGGAR